MIVKFESFLLKFWQCNDLLRVEVKKKVFSDDLFIGFCRQSKGQLHLMQLQRIIACAQGFIKSNCRRHGCQTWHHDQCTNRLCRSCQQSYLQNLFCKAPSLFGIPAYFQILKLGLGESKYNIQFRALSYASYLSLCQSEVDNL